MELNTFAEIGIALGLGLLVGLQRQWVSKRIAGIRTFALVTVFGALTGILTERHGAVILAAGFFAMSVLVIIANLAQFVSKKKVGPGFTTEIAAFSMFAVGALIPSGYPVLATVTAASIALVLYWKEPLHELTRRIGESDFKAIATFILIALVILPLLPEQAYGPYHVFNPFKIWLLVVLIVGISLGAYIVHRVLGQGAGVILGGILGGLISSTATTVTYAQRSKVRERSAGSAITVIMIASTVSFARVLFEIHLVGGENWYQVAMPISVYMILMALLAGYAHHFGSMKEEMLDTREPPSALRAAITFGCIYALILFLVAVSIDHFGDRGLYVVAALSGLIDMDAITLSTAGLVGKGQLSPEVAWRAIIIGALASIVFKGSVAASIGSAYLKRRLTLLFGAAFLLGCLLMASWDSLVAHALALV